MAIAALVGALPLVSGCLCFPSVTHARAGALLPDCLATVTDRATGREVLECLGPPLVVVRQGDAAVRVSDVLYRRYGGTEVPASSFFERFAPGEVAPGDVVYYWREHQIDTRGSGVLLIVGDKAALSGKSRIEEGDDRLWILLDGGTGRVKAHRLERDRPAGDAAEKPAPSDATKTPVPSGASWSSGP
jgi:hypothetical protein